MGLCREESKVITKSTKHSNFHVCVLKSNSLTRDIRVMKICDSLSKKYKVLALGWIRTETVAHEEKINNFFIKRFPLKHEYGKFYSRIVLTIFFNIWILFNLIKYKPNVVHVCDVDVWPSSFIYKMIFKRKIILDIFDRFSFTMKVSMTRRFFENIEEFAIKNVDCVIFTSNNLYNSFNYKPVNYDLILNCPDDFIINKLNEIPDGFKLVFAGYITSIRGVRLVINAVSKMENVKLYLAGIAENKEYLNSLLKNKNIEYKGVLTYYDAMNLQAMSDVIIIPYDPNILMNRIGVPNKLFDAMMLGKPVISTICKDIINDTSCGIYINYNENSLVNAIEILKNNNEYRINLGKNGRKAFINKYNWKTMENKLFILYENLEKLGSQLPVG